VRGYDDGRISPLDDDATVFTTDAAVAAVVMGLTLFLCHFYVRSLFSRYFKTLSTAIHPIGKRGRRFLSYTMTTIIDYIFGYNYLSHCCSTYEDDFIQSIRFMYFLCSFYRAIPVVQARYCNRKSSVCLSVRPSVCKTPVTPRLRPYTATRDRPYCDLCTTCHRPSQNAKQPYC